MARAGMTGREPPAWCRWRAGRRGVLVVAPHGGRCAVSGAGAHDRKVNDLYTADLAGELADTLGASLIANDTLDRNELDLNRVSQVRSRAPWFLDLVESLLAHVLRTHATAEIVFVHGWNVLQPKCDLGIGTTLSAADAVEAHAGALTVSAPYVAERLEGLRARCAAAGIHTAYGERYPGRHRNNVLQLFRRDGGLARGLSPRLAEWAAAGRLEAVQLELGVPLRWPGALRAAFLRTATEAFAAPRVPAVQAARAVSPVPPATASPAALHFCDPRSGLGVMGRVDAAATGNEVNGRLLLFLGGERVALFTGEDVGRRHLTGGGPHFVAQAHGLRLTFEGTLLATDDGRRYVELEEAFAASRLCTAAVDIAFHPGPAGDYGRVQGTISIDGVQQKIDTYGFSGHSVLQHIAGTSRSQVALSAAFGPELAVRLRHVVPGVPGVLHRITPSGATAEPLPPLAVSFDGDPHTPQRFVVGAAGNPLLIAEPLGRMAITRPIGPRTYARVTFGTARVRSHTDGDGFGFFEYARTL